MKTKFSKSTDKEHEIKLESSILHAIWGCNAVHAGGRATVEVKTLFVGDGGKIKIAGKTEKGKKLGRIKDKIYGNGYSGSLDVPENIKPGDMAYFEVELSQLGLKEESDRIPVLPPIEVSNMKWDKKEARRGDTLKLTAKIEGIGDDSKVKAVVYKYDSDGNHEKITELPATVKSNKIEVMWDYDYHDTTANIPDEDEIQKWDKEKHYTHPGYFFTVKVEDDEYGKEQESGILTFKDSVEISLTDEDGKPVPNEKYVLRMPDGSKKEGKLDSDGRAVEKDIPPGTIKVDFPDSQDYSSSKE